MTTHLIKFDYGSKEKVSDVLKEHTKDKTIKIIEFVKYKVGEGV